MSRANSDEILRQIWLNSLWRDPSPNAKTILKVIGVGNGKVKLLVVKDDLTGESGESYDVELDSFLRDVESGDLLAASTGFRPRKT